MSNTFLQTFTVLHYFGKLIAVGTKQDMVHETADSILVKEAVVEIALLLSKSQKRFT